MRSRRLAVEALEQRTPTNAKKAVCLTRALFIVTCVVAVVPVAKGLEFDVTYEGPFTPTQKATFEKVAGAWEKLFSDPITVTLTVQFTDLGPLAAGTSFARTTHPYSNVQQAMIADAGHLFTQEAAAVKKLPTGGLPVLDIGGPASKNKVTMTTANAKALGLGVGLNPSYPQPLGKPDAVIRFNKNTSWDYDNSDGINGLAHDFTGVAAHEVGHALGFMSAIDVLSPNPMPLDFWRFEETTLAHAIGSEARRMTPGPAEYFDSVLNNRSMSQGRAVVDLQCAAMDSRCQAGHWRDGMAENFIPLELLMEPTVSQGELLDIKSDDIHALDYIGYSRFLEVDPAVVQRFNVGWFGPPWWDHDSLPDFGGHFDEFPEPPSPLEVDPPFEANLGARIGMSFAIEGMENRSGTGFARFADEQPNPHDVVELPDEPASEALEILPPSLLDFYFESDREGVRFKARSLLAESGAQLDWSLGDFGGYRLALALDGEGDGVEGDIDARVTVLLLASDAPIPDPDRQNVFTLAPDQSDNGLLVYDTRALGVPEPAAMFLFLCGLCLMQLRRRTPR